MVNKTAVQDLLLCLDTIGYFKYLLLYFASTLNSFTTTYKNKIFQGFSVHNYYWTKLKVISSPTSTYFTQLIINNSLIDTLVLISTMI